MMLSKASAHLYTSGNNIYTIKNSPTNNHLFIVDNNYTRKRCKICSKLIIKTPEWRSTVFVVDFEHIPHLFLVFLLLILNKLVFAGSHPINLKTLKLLTAATINRCTKILRKWQLMKKGLWSEVGVPKKHFFFVVYCVLWNSFFQSTVFLYFMKLVAKQLPM